MTELELETWLYRYSARTEGNLPNPKAFESDNWNLPKNVALHYLPIAAQDLGPEEDYFPTRGFTRQHYVHHIEDMTQKDGNPRFISAFQIKNMIRFYYQKNRKVKRVTKLPLALMDKRYPIVFNYAMIPLRWRYLPTAWARIQRWNNLYGTLCDTVASIAKESTRNHLIFFNLPEVLPPRSKFHAVEEYEQAAHAHGVDGTQRPEFFEGKLRADETRITSFRELFAPLADNLDRILGDAAVKELNEGFESFDEATLGWSDDAEIDLEGCDCDLGFEAWTRVTIGWFPDDDSLQLVDLWRWLGEKREESKLNAIDPAHYEKVFFVFTVGGRYNVLSMAKLNEWREKSGIQTMTQRFHNYLSNMMAFRQLDQRDMILETVPESQADKPETIGMVTAGDSDASVVEDDTDAPEQGEERQTDRRGALGMVAPQFAGGRQLALTDKVMDLNELDNQDITEVTDEDVPELPPERSARVVNKPVKEDLPAVINVDTSNPLEAGVAVKSAELLRKGVISRQEHERHIRLSRKYKEIKVDGVTLEEAAKPPVHDIWNFKPATIPDIPNVVDKGMLQSSLINFDTEYVEKVMPKDTANMVLAIQKAGIAVTGFEREEFSDALSKTVDYRVKVTPVHGKESTLSFQLPKIDENGKYMINGVRYYMRKLRADMPIRKINTHTVALTSYYGKLFVERSQKKVASFDNWILSALTSEILDGSRVKGVVYGNSYGEQQPVPRIYSAIAQSYLEMQIGDIHFHFDYEGIEKNFPGAQVPKTKNQEWPVGHKGSDIVYMDRNGVLKVKGQSIGTIPSLIDLDDNTAPAEIVVLRVMGHEIPLGIVLAYMFGLNKLANRLYGSPVSNESYSEYYSEQYGYISFEHDNTVPNGVYPRRRIKGAKKDTAPNEFEIVFADEVWVLPKDQSYASLIFASLNQWKKQLRTIQVAELNDKAYYTPMFMANGLGNRHLNEIGLIEDMFLDPIAIENLTMMKEPTNMRDLFIRAADMLVDDNYKSDLDTSLMLVKGYERMSGAVYKAIVDSVRNYRNKPLSVKTSVDLNPFEVLTSIQKDPSVSLVEDSNVIHNLKEKENMTYSGTGGRSKVAMTRRTRAFHKTDLGVRSEAGVDSGDVGINMFMPPDPNITSLRGTVQTVDPEKVSPTQLVSTSMLMSPFAEYDDGKRVNFINIQQDHVVAIAESQEMAVRTGYDQVVAHRTDDLFSVTAKDDGKVVSVTDRVITVQYKNGKQKAFQIGRRFGVVTGHVVPHNIVPRMKAGDSFKKGTVICHNEGFYTPDRRDPTSSALKQGCYPYTVLIEKNETWEDSSLMSPELAYKMRANVTHIRTLFVRFDNAIHNLVSVGEEVDIDTVLAVIEDKVSAGVGSDNLDALNLLSRPTPRANNSGKVEEIQVIYFGDKDDMSPSVRKVADKYDRVRGQLARELNNGDATTGEITAPARVDGISVDIDMMAIRIFITEERIMSGGDKLVLSNQLKSVSAGEQRGPTFTASELWPGSGVRKIDLEFSYRAEEARIVHSSIMAGMSIICQEFIGFSTVQAYDS